MNCDYYEKLISLYVEDELTKEEAETLESHLEGCDSCRQQLQAIMYMQSMLRQENNNTKLVSKMRPKIYAKIFRDLLIMFAGLVIIVSMVAISGGLAQIFIFDQISAGIKVLFLTGILLLIAGLIILMYDIFINIFKIICKK